MKRYTLTVTPHSSLFVGGYAPAHGASHGDTAHDAQGMLIPGSVVKGALREAAVRIVGGAGRGEDVMAKLFGTADDEARLRVGPLRPPGEVPDLAVRNHVSLERATRQAAPGRLFQNRVTAAGYGLVFEGELVVEADDDSDELGLLESAVRLTDQIGGGRGRGLGLVALELTLDERPVETAAKVELPDGISTIVLVLEAIEPLQLGAVKDPSNLTTSKLRLDGSAVRGAVAAALARMGADDQLEGVMGGPRPAVFGDGDPSDPAAVPAPLTLREPKAGGAPVDDALRLAAATLNQETFRRAVGSRATKGSFAPANGGWRQVELTRRMVTRTARNVAAGRGADGQLYSLEVIEPPVRFFVPVTGDREQLEWVVRAADDLRIGGDRSRGFGCLRLVEVSSETCLAPLAERHARWAGRLAVGTPEATGVLLALGPLAVDQGRLLRGFEARGLELVHAVSRRQVHGGWNREMNLPRTVVGSFVPGSTFLVRTADGSSALAALEDLEQRGLGPGRPDGWGRLAACHPIHVDCSKEDEA